MRQDIDEKYYKELDIKYVNIQPILTAYDMGTKEKGITSIERIINYTTQINVAMNSKRKSRRNVMSYI